MVACRLYYDISLGTWETGPFLDDIFLISRKFHLVLYGKILIQHWVRPHVPSKPSRRRPAAALKLGSEGSMLSGSYTVQLWSWSVPCQAKTCGGSQVLCAKNTSFFAVRAVCGTEQEKPKPCEGFNITKGKACIVSVFSFHNCRPHLRVSSWFSTVIFGCHQWVSWSSRVGYLIVGSGGVNCACFSGFVYVAYLHYFALQVYWHYIFLGWS